MSGRELGSRDGTFAVRHSSRAGGARGLAVPVILMCPRVRTAPTKVTYR